MTNAVGEKFSVVIVSTLFRIWSRRANACERAACSQKMWAIKAFFASTADMPAPRFI